MGAVTVGDVVFRLDVQAVAGRPVGADLLALHINHNWRDKHMDLERRVKTLRLDANLALRMFRQALEGRPPGLEGLPDDAQVWFVGPDHDSPFSLALTIYSETFEVVPPNQRAPEYTVTTYSTYDGHGTDRIKALVLSDDGPAMMYRERDQP